MNRYAATAHRHRGCLQKYSAPVWFFHGIKTENSTESFTGCFCFDALVSVNNFMFYLRRIFETRSCLTVFADLARYSRMSPCHTFAFRINIPAVCIWGFIFCRYGCENSAEMGSLMKMRGRLDADESRIQEELLREELLR